MAATHPTFNGETNINGKKAKQLRRAARALNLPENTSYAPHGALHKKLQLVKTLEGEIKEMLHPVRRPFAMKACERKAMKEAKRLYKGQVIAGEAYEEPAALVPEGRAFKDLVVDSMTKQPSAPSLGGPGAS
jgi:hypothetical protein